MKKLLSILLAVAMLAAFCSIGFAASSTKTEALIARLNSAKEVTVSLKAGDVPLFGSASNATDTIYVKGNQIAYEYKVAIFTARAVLRDNVVYGYLPLFPLFYVKMNNPGLGGADIWQLIKTASHITTAVLSFQKSYNESDEAGNVYYVEEFNDRATVTSKFYYTGDTLRKLVVTDAANGSTQVTTFEKIEFSAPDSVFAVPTGIDLSAFLLVLFRSGLTALANA